MKNKIKGADDMSRFFSTPKRTAVSTTCIAVIILAIAALINTVSSKDSHVGEIKAGAEALTNASKSDYIGSGHAKAIALEHANLSEGDVRFLRAKLDKDDGIMIYEVSFRLGRTEYEYAIDAVTGDIIGYDIDRD